MTPSPSDEGAPQETLARYRRRDFRVEPHPAVPFPGIRDFLVVSQYLFQLLGADFPGGQPRCTECTGVGYPRWCPDCGTMYEVLYKLSMLTWIA